MQLISVWILALLACAPAARAQGSGAAPRLAASSLSKPLLASLIPSFSLLRNSAIDLGDIALEEALASMVAQASGQEAEMLSPRADGVVANEGLTAANLSAASLGILPLFVTGLTPVGTLPASASSPAAGPDLVLSSSLLARILCGNVSSFADAAVLRLNPHLNGTELLAGEHAISYVRVSEAARDSLPQLLPPLLAVERATRAAGHFASAAEEAAACPAGLLAAAPAVANDFTLLLSAAGRRGAVAVVRSDAVGQQGKSSLQLGLLAPNGASAVTSTPASLLAAAATAAGAQLAAVKQDGWRRSMAPEVHPADASSWPLTVVASAVLDLAAHGGAAAGSAAAVDGHCARLAVLGEFVRWLLAEEAAGQRAAQWGIAALPTDLRDAALERLLLATCASEVLVPSARLEIGGLGASLPADYYEEAAFLYAAVEGSVRVQYRATGSSTGVRTIKAGGAPFAGSDSPFVEADLASNPELLMVPSVAAAVVLIVNVPAIGAAELVLNRSAAADVFRGAIARWNDPVLRALNPAVAGALPDAPIRVVVRSDGSGTTTILTTALSSFDARFAAEVGVSKLPAWPVEAARLTRAEGGNFGVAAAVAATENTIGYAVLSTATQLGVRYATLVNRAGAPVRATRETLQSAIDNAMAAAGGGAGAWLPPAQVCAPDLSLIADLADAGGAGSWPIAAFTYFIVDSCLLPSCEVARETARFILWLLEDPRSHDAALELGFSPLPDGLRAHTVGLLESMRCGADGPAAVFGDCPVGTFYDAATRLCTSCPAGSVPDAAAGACAPCPAGHFQPQAGQSACVPCPVGTYSEAAAATSLDACLPCPSNAATADAGAPHAAHCRCNPGFFWSLPRDEATAAALAPRGDTVAREAAWEAAATADALRAGCLPCSDVQGVEPCAAAGTTLDTLPVQEGFWRRSGDSVTLLRCPVSELCAGGANTTRACAEDSTGPLCMLCGEGAARGAFGKGCGECPQVAVDAAVSLILAALLVSAGPFTVYCCWTSVVSCCGRFVVARAKRTRDLVAAIAATAESLPSVGSGLTATSASIGSAEGADSMGAGNNDFLRPPRGSVTSGGEGRDAWGATYAPAPGAERDEFEPRGGASGDEVADAAPLPTAPLVPRVATEMPAAAKVPDSATAHAWTAAEAPPSGSIQRSDGPRLAADPASAALRVRERVRLWYSAATAALYSRLLPKATILVSYVQIATGFEETLRVVYPSAYLDALALLDVVNFDIGSVLSAFGCWAPLSYLDRLLVSTVAPLGVFTAIAGVLALRIALVGRGIVAPPLPGQPRTWAAVALQLRPLPYSLATLVKRRARRVPGPASRQHAQAGRSASARTMFKTEGQESLYRFLFAVLLRERSTTTLAQAYVLITFLIFPSVSRRILGFWRCDDRFEPELLAGDYAIACGGEAHARMLPWALATLLLYVVGTPVAYFTALWRYSRQLNPRGMWMRPRLLSQRGVEFSAVAHVVRRHRGPADGHDADLDDGLDDLGSSDEEVGIAAAAVAPSETSLIDVRGGIFAIGHVAEITIEWRKRNGGGGSGPRAGADALIGEAAPHAVRRAIHSMAQSFLMRPVTGSVLPGDGVTHEGSGGGGSGGGSAKARVLGAAGTAIQENGQDRLISGVLAFFTLSTLEKRPLLPPAVRAAVCKGAVPEWPARDESASSVAVLIPRRLWLDVRERHAFLHALLEAVPQCEWLHRAAMDPRAADADAFAVLARTGKHAELFASAADLPAMPAPSVAPSRNGTEVQLLEEADDADDPGEGGGRTLGTDGSAGDEQGSNTLPDKPAGSARGNRPAGEGLEKAHTVARGSAKADRLGKARAKAANAAVTRDLVGAPTPMEAVGEAGSGGGSILQASGKNQVCVAIRLTGLPLGEMCKVASIVRAWAPGVGSEREDTKFREMRFAPLLIRFQVLVAKYRPTFWWFELTELLRKLVLGTLLLFVGGTEGVSQIILAILACLAFLLLNAVALPYKNHEDNALNLVAQTGLLLIVVISLLVRTELLGPEGVTDPMLGVLLFGINVVVVACGLVIAVMDVHDATREMQNELEVMVKRIRALEQRSKPSRPPRGPSALPKA